MIRSYVGNNYQAAKTSNPTFPFIIRECENAQPCVTARYDFGVERKVYLLDSNEAEVGQAVKELISAADGVNKAAAIRF